jgi:hypothetical protein
MASMAQIMEQNTAKYSAQIASLTELTFDAG